MWCTSAIQGGFGGAEDLRQTCAHIQISQGKLIHEVWQLLWGYLSHKNTKCGHTSILSKCRKVQSSMSGVHFPHKITHNHIFTLILLSFFWIF